MSDDDPRITRRTTIKGTLSAAAAAGVGAGALAYTPDGATAISEGGIDNDDDVTAEAPGGEIEAFSIQPELFTTVENISLDQIGPSESTATVVELEFTQLSGDEETLTLENPSTESGSFEQSGTDATSDSALDGEVAFDWSDSGEADLLQASEEDGEVVEESFFEPEEEDELSTEVDVDIEIEIVDDQGENTLVTDTLSSSFELTVSDTTADASITIEEGSTLGTSAE